MAAAELLDIGEVVKASGLPASTLRYYEEKGLIEAAGRRGLRRIFEPDVVQRLDLISMGRSAGLSLDEIGSMFKPCGPHIDRGLLLEKAGEMDRTLKRMTAMRDWLYHTAHCPAENHLKCPEFQRLLRINRKVRIKGSK